MKAKDIFVTPYAEGVSTWRLAFPKAQLFVNMDQADFAQLQAEPALVFWLHLNEDRQQWLNKTIQLIRQQSAQAKIAVLANSPNQAEAFYAMSLGAVAYLHAYSPEKVLKEARMVIDHGGVWMGQEFLKRLIEISSGLVGNQAEQVTQHLSLLTPREKEVALEAAKGLSNKEIARVLKITERTVKAHLSAVFTRLQAKDRLHLALMLNQKN